MTVGREGRDLGGARSQWVERDDEAVKKAESAGEWVGCRSQARQNEPTGMKTGMMGRNDT